MTEGPAIPGVRTPEGALRHVREALREARHRAGRGPEEVSRDLHMSLPTLLKIEQGQRPSPVQVIEQMLDYYGFPADDRAQLVRAAQYAWSRIA